MMEFDVLDRVASAEAIEDGAWLHLNAPGTQNPLFRDFKSEDPKEPVRVRVRSIRSRAYQEHDAAEQRKAFNVAKGLVGKKREDALVAFQKGRRARDFVVLVTGFENVSTGAHGVVAPSEEELAEIGQKVSVQWMIDQCFIFARDDENFGPNLEAAPAAKPRSSKGASDS